MSGNPTADLAARIMCRTGASLPTVATVLALTVLELAQNERLQQMAALNDEEHFVEGCRGPQFQGEVAVALFGVRDMLTVEGAESA